MLEVRHGNAVVVLEQKGPGSRAWIIKQAAPGRLCWYEGTTIFQGDPPEWWGTALIRKVQETLNDQAE